METLNTIAYVIYLIITLYITVIVGKNLHHHGKPYLQGIFEDETLYHSINNILLTGYYLLNLGYALVMLQSWENIYSYPHLIEAISTKSGKIIITLGIIHYNNLLIFSLINYFKTKKNVNIN